MFKVLSPHGSPVSIQSVYDKTSKMCLSFFLRWLSCNPPTRCYYNDDYKQKEMLTHFCIMQNTAYTVLFSRRTGIETKVTSVCEFIAPTFYFMWLHSRCNFLCYCFLLTSDFSSLLWRGKHCFFFGVFLWIQILTTLIFGAVTLVHDFQLLCHARHNRYAHILTNTAYTDCVTAHISLVLQPAGFVLYIQ